jgi:hypothetical protein
MSWLAPSLHCSILNRHVSMGTAMTEIYNHVNCLLSKLTSEIDLILIH